MKQGQPLSKYLVSKCESGRGSRDDESSTAQASKGGKGDQNGEDRQGRKAGKSGLDTNFQFTSLLASNDLDVTG